MFKPSRRKLGSLALVSMLCVAAAIPSISAGKTTKKKITCVVQADPSKPNDPGGPIKCPKPLGNGKQSGTIVLPAVTGKWKLKGGTFVWKSQVKLAGQKINGKSQFSKGTGKFKGCTMKGTNIGDLATARVVFKLTLTCKS